MFEKLKKKHKIWCIVGAVICFLVSGVVVAFSVNDIKTLLLKPAALEDLDASDLKEDLKVTAKVRFVMDYYAYTETKGQTTSMEFIIPVGEKEYMGLMCSGSKMRQLKANMELYWDYLDGKDVDVDDISVIEVKGTIQPMKGESLKFYKEFVASLNWSDEEASIFVPYMLKVGEIGKVDTSTLVMKGIMFAIFFIIGLVVLISGIRGNNLKDVMKYCEAKGNKEYELQKIEQFYQMQAPVQGIRANEEYLISVNGSTVRFAPADKLIWAYTHIIQHRQGFIPTGKTYSIMIRRSDGVALDIPMSSENACKQALDYLASVYPYIYIGYDNQWNSMYSKNRGEMTRLVQERKAEMQQLMNNESGYDMNNNSEL